MAKYVVIILFIVCRQNVSVSQACCSGGVPTSSNIGLSSIDPKSIIISASADVNVLQTLKSGPTTLDDDLRERTTQTYFVRSAFSPWEKWQVEVLLPYIIQTRRIITNQGVPDNESTKGIGDISALVTYQWLQNKTTIRSGVGVSLPTGDFDQTNSIGLTLLEDLQPGSGALDFLIFNSLEFSFSNKPSLNLFINTIINLSGTNNDSRGGAQSYTFGNEYQLIAGLSEQYLVGKALLAPNIGMRFRIAKQDNVDSIPNNGSGGRFLFFRSGVSWTLSTRNSLFINGEVPLYSYVKDTQLAPTYRLQIGWNYTIQSNKVDQTDFFKTKLPHP